MNILRNHVFIAACTAATMLAALPAFAGAPAKGAAKEPAKVEPAKEPAKAAPAAVGKVTTGDKAFSGLVPQKVETGAAPAAIEYKKKRGETPTVAPSKEAIIQWFTALNIKHVADEQGRIIVPFRDDAQGVNFNIILIPKVKPSTSNVWAIQAVVPLQLPLPAGDSGLARALIFSNNWNNEHFLNKVSLMQPGDAPFFLLDSTLVCEAGLNQADFFNNFLVLLIQDAVRFAQKGGAELK
jgi:hypothetical protein